MPQWITPKSFRHQPLGLKPCMVVTSTNQRGSQLCHKSQVLLGVKQREPVVTNPRGQQPLIQISMHYNPTLAFTKILNPLL